MGAEAFLSTAWDKKPIQIETGEDFSHLVCAADIDHLLLYAGVGFRIIKYVDGESVSYDIPMRYKVPDIYAIYEAWDLGYSISLDDLSDFWPALIELCQHLESLLHFRSSANIYFTPPGDQCFPPHYDGHEVIVLQVEGEKEWKVWGRKPEYNLEAGSPIENPETLPTPIMETTLKEGDVLYIPQGFPHQARTTMGRSLHISLQFLPVTRKLLVDLMLKMAKHLKIRLPDDLPGDISDPVSRPELNDKLLPGFLDQDLCDELKEWFDVSTRERLACEIKKAIRYGMTNERQPATTGYFGFVDGINSINANTVFRKRNQSLCATGISDGEPWFGFHRHRIVGAKGMEAIFRFIADTDTFRFDELPGNFPEEISKQTVSQLVKQGFLSIEV